MNCSTRRGLMLYGIKIGGEYFDLSEQGESERVFNYCEQKFGYDGYQWEEIKNNFYYEELGELLKLKGIQYEEFIE